MVNATTPSPGALGDPSEADGGGPKNLVDHVLLAAVVVWSAMTLFLLVWQERPQAGPSDSMAHVVLFVGLGFTVHAFVTTRTTSRWVTWTAIAGVLALAAASELVQAAFVPQRNGSFSDLAADVLGVGLGIVLGESLRILPPKGSRMTAAVASTLAVSLIAGFVAVSFVRESAWWRCRGTDGDPIENSMTGLTDGPVLEFDGDADQWTGANGEQVTGSRAPDRAASAAWCAAISSEELTLIVVVDSGAIAQSPMVEVFTTTSGLDGATPNLKVEVRQDFLTIRARHRVLPPRIYSFHVDSVFNGKGQQWIAMRYDDGEMTVDVDADQTLESELDFAFGAWSSEIPIDVAEAGVPGNGPVKYVGFFDRRLPDRGLSDAIAGLYGGD